MTPTPPSSPPYHLIEPLASREVEILILFSEGLSNREIAERLIIADTTVKWYNQRTYDKFCLEKPYRKRRWVVHCARKLSVLPALDEDQDRAPPGDNPYKGLDVFQQEDAPLFFGRETFIEQLLHRLSEDSTIPGFLAVFLVVAVGLSLLTLSAFSIAGDERDRAQDAQAETYRRAVELQQLFWSSMGQQALAHGDSALALRLMVEANQGGQSPPFVQQGLANLAYAPGIAHRTRANLSLTASIVTQSPDGNVAIVSPVTLRSDYLRSSPEYRDYVERFADSNLALWDLTANQKIASLPLSPVDVSSAAVSPNGQKAVFGTYPGKLILIDILTRRLTDSLGDRAFCNVRLAAFSPDGTLALSGSRDHTLTLWEIHDTPEELVAWTLANREVRDLTCAERTLYRVQPLCE